MGLLFWFRVFGCKAEVLKTETISGFWGLCYIWEYSAISKTRGPSQFPFASVRESAKGCVRGYFWGHLSLPHLLIFSDGCL